MNKKNLAILISGMMFFLVLQQFLQTILQSKKD